MKFKLNNRDAANMMHLALQRALIPMTDNPNELMGPAQRMSDSWASKPNDATLL